MTLEINLSVVSEFISKNKTVMRLHSLEILYIQGVRVQWMGRTATSQQLDNDLWFLFTVIITWPTVILHALFYIFLEPLKMSS